MNIYGIIMAGGGGTRFWPLSRKETPKQLLNLSGKEIMVNETIDRLSSFIENENIYIVTNSSQAKPMVKITKGRIKEKHILIEPIGRNTAACIGYAALKILKEKGDGVLVVTPSDAFVKDNVTYAETLKKAIKLADQTNGIVTIGIKPAFPATGYGYIHYQNSNLEEKKVIEFVEKPNEEKAKQYIMAGDYAWNSGIFVWKASVALAKFKEFLPDIYSDLQKIEKSIGTTKEEEIVNQIYPNIRSISIDYGVMEKANDIWVIPAEFGWNDVGSWDMLKVFHDYDENGNIKVGDNLLVETTDSIIFSTNKTITTYGVSNLIIVQTDDAIMVCPKDKAQDVKKIVDALKEKGRNDLL